LDSGLDVEMLEKLAIIIKDKLLNNDVSILLITHRGVASSIFLSQILLML